MLVITQIKYILSLASNNVTDEIRQNFVADLGSDGLNLKILGRIFNTVGKMVVEGNYTVEEANNILIREYAAFNFSNLFGEYDQFLPFVKTVFEEIKTGSNKLLRCKHIIESVDNIQNIAIKYGVCLSVLNCLINSNLVVEDIEFSESIMAFVDKNVSTDDFGTEEFRNFTDLAIMVSVIN